MGGDDFNYGDFEIANEADQNTSSSFNFPLSYNNGNYLPGNRSINAFIGKDSRFTKLK